MERLRAGPDERRVLESSESISFPRRDQAEFSTLPAQAQRLGGACAKVSLKPQRLGKGRNITRENRVSILKLFNIF